MGECQKRKQSHEKGGGGGTFQRKKAALWNIIKKFILYKKCQYFSKF